MTLNKKSILVFIPSYVGGGAEKVTNSIFGSLVERYGYKVELLTLKTNDYSVEQARESHLQLTELNVGTDLRRPEVENAILEYMRSSDAANIVYVASTPENAERFRKELPDRNIIFHLHSTPQWEPIVRLLGSRQFALNLGPIKRYIKWYLLKYLKERWLKVYTRRFGRKLRKIYDNVNHFVVLTQGYVAQTAKMTGVKSENSKFKAIYNPFDPTQFLSLQKSDRNKEILYVGRLQCVEKGVDNLLRAWKRIAHHHPDWTLKIVGSGPDAGYLEYLVSVLDIPRVKFYPYSSDLTEHYSTASVLCLPSNIEGWGLVLIEAMASGVVPVAFNCSSGVGELLGNNRGVLVKPGSYDRLGKGISDAITNLHERQRVLQTPETIDFLRQFTVEKAVDEFRTLLL